MRLLPSVVALAAGTLLGGCSRTPPNSATPMGFLGPVWNSTLTAPAGTATPAISGYGMMIGNAEHTRTRVQLDLRHARAGSELPWHLHRGSCGNDQGIVGDPARYLPLKVGADGAASGGATLDLPLPDSGQFMLNVHASSMDMDSIVACGNMTGPSS